MSETSAQAAAERQRLPRYASEQAIPERTASNDEAALKMAKLALDAKNRLRDKRNLRAKEGQGEDSAAKKQEEARQEAVGVEQQDTQIDAGGATGATIHQGAQEDSSHASQESSDSPVSWPEQDSVDAGRDGLRLPLKSMYDGSGEWPKKVGKGGRQCSWSNVGFPCDKSLVVLDFEEDTYIDGDQPYISKLARDISNIVSKEPDEIADDGAVVTVQGHNRAIETFKVHGRTVCRVRFSDVDAFCKGSPYSLSQVSKLLEQKIDKEFGKQPDMKVERWVTAHVLLSMGGQIGGRTDDYWQKARGLAQQQLYLNPDMEGQVRQQIDAGDLEKDPAFSKMMIYVEKGCRNKTHNPYHQARRNEYAVDNGLPYKIKDVDIVLVLDQADNIIIFQCTNVFDHLLTKAVQKQTVQSFETYSTLTPVPFPDMTRHGLHWVSFLAERPDLDFRNPDNDPRLAKSGVFHIGGRCQVGDPNGKKRPRNTKDTEASRLPEKGFDVGDASYYQVKLRHSALGACTEISKFFFKLLDPELLEKYTRVADEVAKGEYVHFQTRRSGEPFVMRALLVNLMTYEHRDTGDWHRGYAFLLPVGDYSGGDLVLRELGLQIEAPPGCLQMFRGRELRHSITKWTGRRFVCVNVTHEAVRRWALRSLGEEVTESPTSLASSIMADCIDQEPEDIVPEHQRVLSEREMFPETYESEEELEGSEQGSSEASLPSGAERKRTSGTKHRADSSSDASAEASDDGESAAKRQKKA